MHHLAVMGEHGGLHQLVFHIDGEHLLLLVDHGLKEGVEVLRIEQRSGCSDTTGHIKMADDLHAIGGGDDLTRLRAFHIAATLDREIDDDGARPHRLHHVGADKARRGPARNERRGDDDVLLGDVIGDEFGLGLLLFVCQFTGIAALTRGILQGLGHDELRAERLDLLAGSRTNVGGGDDSAQTARGGDGLKTGNASAHDEHLGGGYGAGSGHHHRQRTVIFGGGVDHRTVTGKVCLRGQNVHGLGARDARHELHGKGGDACSGHGRHIALIAIGVHAGENQRAFFVGFDFGRRRAPQLQDDIGLAGIRSLADLCAGLLKFSIDNTRLLACVFFDDNIETQAHKSLDRFRRDRNAAFRNVNFFRHKYALSHRHILSVGPSPQSRSRGNDPTSRQATLSSAATRRRPPRSE